MDNETLSTAVLNLLQPTRITALDIFFPSFVFLLIKIIFKRMYKFGKKKIFCKKRIYKYYEEGFWVNPFVEIVSTNM